MAFAQNSRIKRSDYTKQKISQSNSKPKPQGFGEKIKNIKINTPNYNLRKSILQYDKHGNFIKEWESIREASNNLNINETAISQNLNNKQKSSGNYIWKYKEN